MIGNNMCLSQVAPEVKNLVPWEYVSESLSKTSSVILGLEPYVKVAISADLSDTDACMDKSVTPNGLSLDYMWFNANNETGKMMMDMHIDLNGVLQEKDNFKLDGATEEAFMNGTLWIISGSSECINTISGPTGKTEYQTKMRYFGFNENCVRKIELLCKCKPDKAKQILKSTIQLANGFDFSSLMKISKTN